MERTEWTQLLPLPLPAPPQLPETPLTTCLSGTGLPVPPSIFSHLPLITEPQISALSLAAQTTSPKAKKTFASAYYCRLDSDTVSPQNKGKGRKENVWHH